MYSFLQRAYAFKLRHFAFLLLLQAGVLFAAAVYDGKPLPEDVNERCRIGVIEMIKIRETGLEHIKREERREEVENKIITWKKRIETDEDPCLIYRDVFNDAFK